MKYYWIASTLDIKTALLPCREINTKNYVIFADFKSFLQYFQVIELRALIIIMNQGSKVWKVKNTNPKSYLDLYFIHKISAVKGTD